MSKVGIVVFPGTNCEHDVARALANLGVQSELVWHGDSDLSSYSGVIIPGGFAHGDYLRPGAIARFSKIMSEIISCANSGVPVLGICNGFQVLTEAGLLPGALQKNSGLRFICQPEALEVVTTRSITTSQLSPGDRITLPINHFEGNYTCDSQTLNLLIDNDQIVMRYIDNPNGSIDNIAAISNKGGNVVGMMPHPERASSALLGNSDGLKVLASFAASLVVGAL
ncbi:MULTISPECIES: phosphoribosylformylglycinamidine synthase subunit PurQ [Acidithrix]|uniref:Phosphoribosylformylglycinamidine synthase subunit PurQ n=1 Tax=Acidithrix ferrooxidans TaxID=1280514 RepID=A0A0D8HJ67_9ACTN|nr:MULTISPECIES: phosphoribosylformylglycinamidine synthase subunit PurQ [Acidithrix]KJF17899.1 phosphoribosylformylglycinamidine synthase 1 [Acidithrix ferrooxidans]CAG4934040.1 unnamed protein product [Acidithrix sp. C25]